MIEDKFKFFVKNKKNVDISFKNITLSFAQKKIFEHMSFIIKSKGVSVIMGPNGSGKTLCLKLISNIIKPNSGYIEFKANGRIDISYVSQKTIFLRRSIIENLQYVLRIKRFLNSDINFLISKVLEIINFDKSPNLSARKLSVGQQQLLSIMRGLITRPNILLLDEPFSNLDYRYTILVEKLIKKINQAGIKIILVTHDLIQAAKLGDDIFFLSNGKIIEHKIFNKNLKKNFFELYSKNISYW